MEIKIMRNILDRNQNKAAEVRALLASDKVMMVNIISSPEQERQHCLNIPVVRLAEISG